MMDAFHIHAYVQSNKFTRNAEFPKKNFVGQERVKKIYS